MWDLSALLCVNEVRGHLIDSNATTGTTTGYRNLRGVNVLAELLLFAHEQRGDSPNRGPLQSSARFPSPIQPVPLKRKCSMRVPVVLSVVIASLAVGAIADADVLQLKNGDRVEGVFRQADQVSMTVEVGGQFVTLAADQVQAIQFGDSPPIANATPSTAAAQNALTALKTLRSAIGAVRWTIQTRLHFSHW